jgi:hypothetical protein
MHPPFDLFRQESAGSVLWLGVAASMDEANQKIAAHLTQIPANYLIVSLRTGTQQLISPPTR